MFPRCGRTRLLRPIVPAALEKSLFLGLSNLQLVLCNLSVTVRPCRRLEDNN